MVWFVSSFTEICEPHLRLVVRSLFQICSLIVFTTLWFFRTIHQQLAEALKHIALANDLNFNEKLIFYLNVDRFCVIYIDSILHFCKQNYKMDRLSNFSSTSSAHGFFILEWFFWWLFWQLFWHSQKTFMTQNSH